MEIAQEKYEWIQDCLPASVAMYLLNASLYVAVHLLRIHHRGAQIV